MSHHFADKDKEATYQHWLKTGHWLVKTDDVDSQSPLFGLWWCPTCELYFAVAA